VQVNGAELELVILTERAADGSLVVAAPGDGLVFLDEHGHMPLPPYIERADAVADRERYQTMFARVPGAVAAPTAGLHMTPAIAGALAVRGITLATITLRRLGNVAPSARRPACASHAPRALCHPRPPRRSSLRAPDRRAPAPPRCARSGGGRRAASPGAGATGVRLPGGDTRFTRSITDHCFHLPESTSRC
jgi:S-adenosylmethionine:tRNA ribosyltransferase-isomerase